MKLFDTHAHCDDERFMNEYEGGTDGVIRDCLNDKIGNIVNIGTNLDNSKRSIELSEKYDEVYATVGIHPTDAELYDDVDDVICQLEKMLFHPKVVAIGEIGLDYHWQNVPREKQILFFKKQMELAAKHNIPVVIHDREAHGDCFEIIKEFPTVKGIFHCFSGSAEMARELVRLGWYISFAGAITYKNAIQPKEACKAVPDDRLLIETDAPYLTPVPHRGELNRSSYVYFTACEVANQRGTTVDEIAKITYENAKRVFRIG
ncbi:MAG: TatD family hydrolase [Clostridia bacterium]|nr:TatD family hydrolase [Clostridia bacterium]